MGGGGVAPDPNLDGGQGTVSGMFANAGGGGGGGGGGGDGGGNGGAMGAGPGAGGGADCRIKVAEFIGGLVQVQTI